MPNLDLTETQSALWRAECELSQIAAQRAAELREQAQQIAAEAERVEKQRSGRVRRTLDLFVEGIPDEATFDEQGGVVTISWEAADAPLEGST